MFIKKPKKGIYLYINYYKLNAIIYKDKYPLLFINKTIANIIGYKIITKLNI